MLRGLFTLAFLLAILAPFPAQSAGRPIFDDVYDDVLVQNLCASDTNDDDEATASMALNDKQSAKLRIELLERGFNPGFDVQPVDADATLTEAIRMFQAEFSLRITGLPDPATLFILGMPVQKTSGSDVWTLVDASEMGRRILYVDCRQSPEAAAAHR